MIRKLLQGLEVGLIVRGDFLEARIDRSNDRDSARMSAGSPAVMVNGPAPAAVPVTVAT
jgi:hypothetical protein